jgi:hypothetical protein
MIHLLAFEANRAECTLFVLGWVGGSAWLPG